MACWDGDGPGSSASPCATSTGSPVSRSSALESGVSRRIVAMARKLSSLEVRRHARARTASSAFSSRREDVWVVHPTRPASVAGHERGVVGVMLGSLAAGARAEHREVGEDVGAKDGRGPGDESAEAVAHQVHAAPLGDPFRDGDRVVGEASAASTRRRRGARSSRPVRAGCTRTTPIPVPRRARREMRWSSFEPVKPGTKRATPRVFASGPARRKAVEAVEGEECSSESGSARPPNVTPRPVGRDSGSHRAV